MRDLSMSLVTAGNKIPYNLPRQNLDHSEDDLGTGMLPTELK